MAGRRDRGRLALAKGAGSKGGAILSSLRAGWRYVRSRRVIIGVLVATLVANFWGFAYITMVPVIGEQVLGLSAFPIGVILSVQGLGALVGALVIARASEPRTYTRIFLASTTVFLAGVLGFGAPRGSRCRSC